MQCLHIRLILLILLLVVHNAIYACNAQDNASSEQFDIENDTIIDIDSGLTWMRCAIGQSWDGKTCAGEAALLTWHEANDKLKEIINSNQQAPDSDWRLPRLNELATIVDISCNNPRIDLSVFPHTPAIYYWTSSRVPRGFGEAYVLSFGSDKVASKALDARYAVRLVRGRSNTLN